MLLIKFEEELKNGLDDLISGLLPHENYEPKMFLPIYENILRYVHVEEMPLEYRILFNIFEDAIKIFSGAASYGLFITVTRDTVESILESSLMEFISVEGYKFKKWFEEKGVDTNFNLPTSQEQGASIVYQEVLDLYDRCYNKAISSTETVARFLPFRNLFIQGVAEANMEAQIGITRDKVWFNNRYYKGYNDWLDFVTTSSDELKYRLDDSLHTTAESMDDSTKIQTILKKAAESYKKLSDYGIDPIDESTPMTAYSLCVVAANSNVGKTLFCTYLASNLIAQGNKVLFMCGEAPKDKILSHIMSSFIYKKYGKFVSDRQIIGKVPAPEEVHRLINLASIELANLRESGCLVLRDAYSYENLDKELVKDYETYGMDAVFIDHSLTLIRSGKMFNDKDCVDTLAIKCRDFKRKYPVFVCISSHLSVVAQGELEKTGSIVNAAYVTKASSVLHGEADDIHVLVSNKELEKQNLRSILSVKRRDGGKTYEHTYLKVLFNANQWIYDPKYQNGGVNSVDAQMAYNQIESTYMDKEDGDFEIDLD